jgi:hypothetical protein
MHVLKQKNLIYLIIFVVLVGGFTWYYFYKKNIKLLKSQIINWANTDTDLTSRQKRINGLNLMPDSEIKILAKIVNEYFATNTQLTADLLKFWDYATGKYGIGGSSGNFVPQTK